MAAFPGTLSLFQIRRRKRDKKEKEQVVMENMSNANVMPVMI